MNRLALVSYRPPHHPGGATARWRSLIPALAERGWHVDVVASDTVDDLAAPDAKREAVNRRAQRIAQIKPLVRRPFLAVGLQPPPRSTLWMMRGALKARRQLRTRPDVLVATGPPMVALLAARLAILGRDVPFLVDLRDLWAGNPMYDQGSSILPRLERWIFARAERVVVCTEEARADILTRHPELIRRCVVIPNGFEPILLERRAAPAGRHEPRVILHSGVLTDQRPIAPVLDALGDPELGANFRVVLHGYMAPEIERQVRGAPLGVTVDVVAPSDWQDAVSRIAACDVALITQSRDAGDATAVASKVYEYLALGKPVLCVTDGGATEGLLRRLGADRHCARLGDPASIREALRRLASHEPDPPVSEQLLAPFSRAAIADAMADLLLGVSEGRAARAPDMQAAEEKSRVRAYWENEPCGSNFAQAPVGTPDYFRQIEQHRYAVEPFIADYADFGGAAGKDLLEIGTGMGTDFVQFVRAGARATGIDLTQASIDNVRARLELEGLSAAELRRADSENLPFADASFDRVYSWGVLHHTPRTEAAVAEAIRVLRPGGSLCIMLYHRHSWVVYGHWVKFALLKGRPLQGLNSVVRHHVESIGTKAYNRRELQALFAGVDDLTIDVVSTVYDERFGRRLAKLTQQLGWNAVVCARKPA